MAEETPAERDARLREWARQKGEEMARREQERRDREARDKDKDK